MTLRKSGHASLAGAPIMLRKGWPHDPAKLPQKWPHEAANRHQPRCGKTTKEPFSVESAASTTACSRYRYELIERPIEYDGCILASPTDIAAMKMTAIVQRAPNRDYVDLMCCQRANP